jgi:hypothetical protein
MRFARQVSDESGDQFFCVNELTLQLNLLLLLLSFDKFIDELDFAFFVRKLTQSQLNLLFVRGIDH